MWTVDPSKLPNWNPLKDAGLVWITKKAKDLPKGFTSLKGRKINDLDENTTIKVLIKNNPYI